MFALCAALLLPSIIGTTSVDPAHTNPLQAGSLTLPDAGSGDVLVIYAYKDSDAVQKQNLLYFVHTAVRENNGVDYVFVDMDAPTCGVFELLPKYSNVHTLCRENKGFDLCAHATVMADGRYPQKKYLVMMNSSGRGPFVQAHCRFVDQSMPMLQAACNSTSATPAALSSNWLERITGSLTDQVKLVGAYINCEVAPHVQSWMMATEWSSISLLNESLKCYDSYDDAIQLGEVGTSQQLLHKGFNIGSMISAYQHRDFRNPTTHGCNEKINPGYGHQFCEDSSGYATERCHSLTPIETMFVKNAGGLARGNVLDEKLMAEVDRLTAQIMQAHK